MPYIVGRDPDSGDIIVGDTRSFAFFLRGMATNEKAIRDLVQAANERFHLGDAMAKSIAKQIEDGDVVR